MVSGLNDSQDIFLDLIHAELKNRNLQETEPFISLHASNKALQQLVDMLEAKCENLEKDYTYQKLQLEEFKHNIGNEGGGDTSSNSTLSKSNKAATAALIRNEAKLRDKLEKIQEELQNTLRDKSEDTLKALELQQDLSNLKDLKTKNEKTIVNLTEDVDRAQTAMSHLQQQLEDAKSNHNLAEQQYDGLKTSIREYQNENDSLVKENRILVERVVTEKEKVSGEINVLNEMVEKLKLEVEMLRSYQTLETQQRQAGTGTQTSTATVDKASHGNKVGKFFGKALHGGSKKGITTGNSAHSTSVSTNTTISTPDNHNTNPKSSKPSTPSTSPHKWCETGVVLPTIPKFNMKAYSAEATCIRYDPELDLCCTSGTDMDHHHGVGGIKTAGTSSTIKVWNTSKGVQTTTLHVSGGLSSFGRSNSQQNMILTCDMGGGLVVGGSTDKTCRVWNLQTSRMIHQLVGHGHKVTCARLLPHLKSVLTGSADRSLKLWDISRSTYRQTLTFHPQSTPNCIDILMSSPAAASTSSTNSSTTTLAVSGQIDGSLKFWDLQRGGNRCVQDIPHLHGDGGGGGIVSAQFSPVTPTQVLTCGKDNTLKIIDTRRVKTSSHSSSGQSSSQALVEMRHHDFFVGGSSGHGGSASVAALSPDGKYAIAGSSSDGTIFVWRALDGSLERKIGPGNEGNNGTIDSHKVGVCGLTWGHGGTSGQQVASVDRKGHMVLWA